VFHPRGLFPVPISAEDIANDGDPKRMHIMCVIGQWTQMDGLHGHRPSDGLGRRKGRGGCGELGKLGKIYVVFMSHSIR
jgi:hypothetical protein